MRLLPVVLALFSARLAHAADDKPLLLQKPTISKMHIAFSFAGDLWTVPRDGGEARRLTSGTGLESDPIYSPDGKWIAFTGDYDGNQDAYVIPATGGEPRRLTYHPANDFTLGWTPDGKSVLIASGRTSYSRFNKLFAVPVEGGGLPEELPLPMGEQGAYSADGKRIAYVPLWNRRNSQNAYIAWKHYRGGKAAAIWIADLVDSRIEKLPREDSNDYCPMWLNGKVYFLSDREFATTLFSYDPATKKVKRELSNSGLDYISASAGPDAIVLEQFGALQIFDPKTGEAKPVNVKITGDFPNTRPHFEKVGKRITNASVSPTGMRAVFEARGEILTVPAEKGDIRNLTQTPGAVERDPAWSPDGKTIAYFSDESGDYMLHLKDAKGTGDSKRLKLGDAPNFYFNPVWSPDSKMIAYADNRQKLWVIEIASGKNTNIDQHTYFTGPQFDISWSPDSRWLTYTKVLANKLRAAFLFDVEKGNGRQITDGMSDARHTVFDKSGKYLYFTASTDIGPTTNGIDMSGMFRPVSRSAYVVVLDKTQPSPFAPESDEEKGTPEAKSVEPKVAPKTVTVKIDLDDIDQRTLALPLPARNYVGLQAGKAGSLFMLEGPSALGGPEAAARGLTVSKFDLATRKSDTVMSGVSAFELTASGDKALVRQGERWSISPVAAAPVGVPSAPSRQAAPTATATPGGLKTDDMEVHVDPRAEWKQMYHEAWRLQRHFLYDANSHGYDLALGEKKYAAFLPGIHHRADLNYLFNEMLGNMVLGHTYISGGASADVPPVKGGLLGADLVIENDRYKFAKIFSGENWNPSLRAPLTQPGVNVKPGEYLLAVNGKELKGADNVYRAFEATAGKATTIKVGAKPDGAGARDVTVIPLESETPLRNLGWVEDNRRKVAKLSDGKVAYVYLPDTALGGYANFNRYFFAQVDRQAVVIDERFNGGGKAADYIIDYLRRPLLNYWAARDGKVYTTPGGAIFGPKAMIVNEFAGSGGDAMPWYFRRANLGPLVGKRTWGGLVGISGYPPLLDGGQVTAPSFAFFSPEGKWDVENYGVKPDVEIEHDPYEIRKGKDPQLEKALELVLEALKKNPLPEPKKPEYPNYHKKQ